MGKKLTALLWFLFTGGTVPVSAVQASTLNVHRQADLPFRLFGDVTLRHHASAYGANSAQEKGQSISTHARMRVGTFLYGDRLTLHLDVGGYKAPGSLGVRAVRTKVGQQARLIGAGPFVLHQYSNWRFPNGQDDEPDVFDPFRPEGALETLEIQAGVYPTLNFHTTMLGMVSVWQVGWDLSSKLYGTDQTASLSKQVEVAPQSALAKKAPEQESVTFSDYVPRLQSLITSSWEARVLPYAALGLGVFYDSHYGPDYFWSNLASERVGYRYQVQRHTRLRLRVEVRVSAFVLTNDIYQYYDGFFQSQDVGDLPRWRNIAKVAVVL